MRAKLIITIAVILVGMVVSVLGQQAYKPTEIQAAKLENLQLKAQIAQRDLQEMQKRFQQALTDLTNEAAKVKKENGWPDNVQFEPNNLVFTESKDEKGAKNPSIPKN